MLQHNHYVPSTMMKSLMIFTCVLVMVAMGYFSHIALKEKSHYIMRFFTFNTTETSVVPRNEMSDGISANDILKDGNGILFLETTDRMEPPSLVLCALESTARTYPDRPVVFFMKGLGDITTKEEENKAKHRFPSLSSINNIYFFPLRMDELFNKTPLMAWYKKTDPNKERYWIHVLSDACRFGIMWKYGGIYMDTDIISLRPIPYDRFVVAEDNTMTSAGAFAFPPSDNVTWQFINNFVDNYRGEIWGHQGPGVFTRVRRKLCGTPVFKSAEDVMCNNIHYFHPRRFYAIFYSHWKKFFEVCEKMPDFSNSYGLHFWNFLNKEGKHMVPGSNTLVELLYKQYCPSTYGLVLKTQKT